MVKRVITINDAVNILLNEYRNHKIVNAFDLSDKYVFVLYPLSVDPSEKILLDPFYSVNKYSGVVEEYTPLMDLEEFKRASKNPLLI